MRIATIETSDNEYVQLDSLNLKFFLPSICLYTHLSIIVPGIILKKTINSNKKITIKKRNIFCSIPQMPLK